MKVKVNSEACIGCGLCTSCCEEVFQINDEGVSEVVAEKVTDEQKESVNDALEGCPTGAIVEVSEDAE